MLWQGCPDPRPRRPPNMTFGYVGRFWTTPHLDNDATPHTPLEIIHPDGVTPRRTAEQPGALRVQAGVPRCPRCCHRIEQRADNRSLSRPSPSKHTRTGHSQGRSEEPRPAGRGRLKSLVPLTWILHPCWVGPYPLWIAGVAGECGGDCDAPGIYMKGWSGPG